MLMVCLYLLCSVEQQTAELIVECETVINNWTSSVKEKHYVSNFQYLHTVTRIWAGLSSIQFSAGAKDFFCCFSVLLLLQVVIRLTSNFFLTQNTTFNLNLRVHPVAFLSFWHL
jgi:hypothetical protein